VSKITILTAVKILKISKTLTRLQSFGALKVSEHGLKEKQLRKLNFLIINSSI
jgi:hypothetical protein